MRSIVNSTPILIAFFANILWGSTFIVSKLNLSFGPPFTSLFLRFFIASVVIWTISRLLQINLRWTMFLANWPSIIRLSFFGYFILYAAQIFGLNYIPSALSAVIMLLAPLFTVLLTSFSFGKLNKLTLFGVVAAVLSSLFLIDNKNLSSFNPNAPLGIALTLIASFLLGWSVVATKSLLTIPGKDGKLTPIELTFFCMVISELGFLLLGLTEINGKQIGFLVSADYWIQILYLGIFCSAFAFFLWNWALIRISPIVGASAMYIKTPVAILLGWIILDEALGLRFYIGTILVMGSIYLIQSSEKLNPRKD